MSKEKQIDLVDKFRSELMDKFIDLCRGNDYNKLTLLKIGDTVDQIFDKQIKDIFKDILGDEDGYRKQRVGEWVTNAWDGKKWIIIPYNKHEHVGAHCSVCKKRALLNHDRDEVTSNYCPNCGAKMGGGLE